MAAVHLPRHAAFHDVFKDGGFGGILLERDYQALLGVGGQDLVLLDHPLDDVRRGAVHHRRLQLLHESGLCDIDDLQIDIELLLDVCFARSPLHRIVRRKAPQGDLLLGGQAKT